MSEYVAFADVNNLEQSVKYLNSSLATLGIPVSLDLFSNDPESVARTCNCLLDLLQQREQDAAQKQLLEDEVAALKLELSAKDEDEARFVAEYLSSPSTSQSVCPAKIFWALDKKIDMLEAALAEEHQRRCCCCRSEEGQHDEIAPH